MKKLGIVTMALLLAAVWSRAQAPAKNAAHAEAGAAGVAKAICVLHPTKDHKAHGIIRFTVNGDAIDITGEIMGLAPGEHAFHVHEFGDCSSDDGMSTGGHFNPDKKPHGGPHAKERHVGDLGNIKADGTGKAVIKIHDTVIKLHGPHSILGRALIIHAGVDDLKTQPTGNAGGRVACGVIGVAK